MIFLSFFLLAVTLVPEPTWGEVGRLTGYMSMGSDHATFLLANGTTVCFGNDAYGACGTAEYADIAFVHSLTYRDYMSGTFNGVPHPLDGLRIGSGVKGTDKMPGDEIVRVKAMHFTTCFIHRSRRLTCCGRSSIRTQIFEYPCKRIPVDELDAVEFGSPTLGVKEISGGRDNICVLFFTGKVRCYGWNPHGNLGQGDMYDRMGYYGQTPFVPDIKLAEPSEVIDIYSQPFHVCTLMTTHNMRCWGANAPGQIPPRTAGDPVGGNPYDVYNLTDIALPSGRKVRNFGGTGSAFVVVTDNGKVTTMGAQVATILGRSSVWTVGFNDVGAHTDIATLPYFVWSDTMPARDVATDASVGCVIFSQDGVEYGGRVRCWGDSSIGAHGATVVSVGGSGVATIPYIDFGDTYRAVDIDATLGSICVLFEISYGDLRPRCWGYGTSYRTGNTDDQHSGALASKPISSAPLLDFGGTRLKLWDAYPYLLCADAVSAARVAVWGPRVYMWQTDKVRLTDTSSGYSVVITAAETLAHRLSFDAPLTWPVPAGANFTTATIEVGGGPRGYLLCEGVELTFARPFTTGEVVSPTNVVVGGGLELVVRLAQYANVSHLADGRCVLGGSPDVPLRPFARNITSPDPEVASSLLTCGLLGDLSSIAPSVAGGSSLSVNVTVSPGVGFPDVLIGDVVLYEPRIVSTSLGYVSVLGGNNVTINGTGFIDFGEGVVVVISAPDLAGSPSINHTATLVSPTEVQVTMPSLETFPWGIFDGARVFISVSTRPSSIDTQRTPPVILEVFGRIEMLTINPPSVFHPVAHQIAYVNANNLRDVRSVGGYMPATARPDVQHGLCKFTLAGMEVILPHLFDGTRFEAGVTVPTMNGTLGDGLVYISLDAGQSWAEPPLLFVWFRLDTLAPRGGPVDGGTLLLLSGQHIPQDSSGIRCSMNGTAPRRPLYASREVVMCYSAPHWETDTLAMLLSVDHGASYFPLDREQFDFTYFNVTLQGSYPKIAPGVSESPLGWVTLTGSGFANISGATAECQFGGGTSGDVYELGTSTELRSTPGAGPGGEDLFECRLPPDGIGVRTMRVTLNGLEYFEAEPDPKQASVAFFSLARVSPVAGPASGGTLVTVSGTGFSTTIPLWCRFGPGTAPVPATVLFTSTATCVAPALPGPAVNGTVALEVRHDGTQFTANARTFTYFTNPVITALMPESGRSGTLVTVVGAHLSDDHAPPLCTFGGIESPSAYLYVPGLPISAFVCEAPLLVGRVDVRVSLNGGIDMAAGTLSFQYVTTVGASPPLGPSAGGTSVGLSGSGFSVVPGTLPLCRFGAASDPLAVVVNATFKSVGYAECVAPASPNGTSSSGAVPVAYAPAPGLAFSDTSATFAFYAPPNVTALSPAYGPAGGSPAAVAMGYTEGLTITIYGTGLVTSGATSALTMCRFGSSTSANATQVSPTMLLCELPAGVGTVPVEVSLNGGVDWITGGGPGASLVSGGTFQYTSLVTVQPAAGPASGGTSITLSAIGVSQDPGSRCVVGGAAVNASSARPSIAVCVSPPASSAPPPGGTVAVDVDYHAAGTVRTGDPLSFVYYEDPVVTLLDPVRGPGQGGFPVTIWGSSFGGAGLEARAAFGSRTTSSGAPIDTSGGTGGAWYSVAVAPVGVIGDVPVEISLNAGSDFTSSKVTFTFYAVFSLIPDAGPALGGSDVILSGTGFAGAAPGDVFCKFGSVQVPATVISAAQARCVAPASADLNAVVAVEFTADGARFTNGGTKYTYFPSPVVTLIHPPGAPPGSSVSSVTVYGKNFGTDPASLRCKLGDTVSANATIAGPGRVICPLTDGTGNVPVTVSFNKGYAYAPPTAIFTYLSLFAVEPRAGPETGGTEVLVSGAGFQQTALSRCAFGPSRTAAATVLRLSQAVCTSPPAPPGVVPVSFSADGSTYTSPGSVTYAYYKAPHVSSVVPTTGPSAGGHTVTVYGTDFPDPAHANFTGLINVQCRIGVEIVPGTRLGPTMVTCISPPGSGVVDVELTFNGGFHFTADKITTGYFAVFTLRPSSVPTGSSTTVTVSGARFAEGSTTASCRFSPASGGGASATAPATFVISSQVTCEAPSSLAPGSYHVEYTSDGLFYTADARVFNVFGSPEVLKLSPRAGPSSGGTKVTVYGKGFFVPTDPSGAKCRFYIFASDAEVVVPAGGGGDPYVVCASSPAGGGQMSVEVSLNGGATYTDQGVPFYFFYLSSIKPRRGPVAGGTVVTVSGNGLVDDVFANGRASCLFGANGLGRLEYIDAFRMTCMAPNATATGPIEVDVAVHITEGNSVVTGGAAMRFGYYGQPNITSLIPAGGPTSGGTGVVMRGEGLFAAADIKCRFGSGGEAVDALVSTTRTGSVLQCVTPAGTGPVDVSVAFNAEDFVPAGSFTYFVVNLNTPTSAPVTGGTVVLLVGSGFWDDPGIACTIGTLPGKARFLSSDRVSCEVPFFADVVDPTSPLMAGTVPGTLEIGLAIDGIGYARSPEITLRLYTPPTITSFTPVRSVTSGGIPITLFGKGFLTDAEKPLCRFGRTAGTYSTLVVTNATYAVCPSTSNVPADVAVSASLNGGSDWSDAPGLLSYSQCAAGQFAATHQDPCRECPAGLFSRDEGARECTICPPDAYTDRPGMAECTPCPDNSAIEDTSRDALTKCLCEEGYYHRTLEPGSECVRCPVGANCPGGTEPPSPRQGFWTASSAIKGVANEFLVLECAARESCAGGGPESCADGYEGRLCALCSEGYFKSGSECRECPDSSYFSIVAFFVFVLILCALLIRLVGSDASAYGGTIVIVCHFAQVISILAKLDLKWPADLQKTMAIMSSPFSLDIDVLASECSIPGMNYEKKWAAKMLLPWVFVLVFGVVYVVSRFIAACRGSNVAAAVAAGTIDEDDAAAAAGSGGAAGIVGGTVTGSDGRKRPQDASLGDGLVNALLLFGALIYLMLVTTSLELFDCTLNEDGQASLDAQPNLICYEDWWYRLVPAALFGSIAYGVMIPVAFTALLYRQRGSLGMPIVIGRYGSIFVDYSPERFYWESVVMCEKLMMAVVLTFFTKYTSAQLLAFLLVAVMGLAAHIVAYPFFLPRYNTLQTILRWCSCLVIVAGMLFNAGQFPDKFLQDLVTYGVFGIIGGSTLLVAGIVVYDVHVIRKSLRTKFSPAALRAVDKALTPQGKTLVMEWLGSGVDAEVATLFDRVIADIGAFYLSGKFYKECGLVPGECIPDTATRVFCGSVFVTPAVPAARRWFERHLETATTAARVIERDGRSALSGRARAKAEASLARVRAFLLCFTQRAKFNFYSKLGAKGTAVAEGGVGGYVPPDWLEDVAYTLGAPLDATWPDVVTDDKKMEGGDDEFYEWVGN